MNDKDPSSACFRWDYSRNLLFLPHETAEKLGEVGILPQNFDYSNFQLSL